MLAAESLGLGSCYMGTTLNAMDGLCEFYELPPGVAPVTSVVLGWPDEDPLPRLAAQMQASGVCNLAQVYTRLKYLKPDFDEASRRIFATLRRQGFMGQEQSADV